MDKILKLLDGLTIEQKKRFRDYLRYLLSLEDKQWPSPSTGKKAG